MTATLLLLDFDRFSSQWNFIGEYFCVRFFSKEISEQSSRALSPFRNRYFDSYDFIRELHSLRIHGRTDSFPLFKFLSPFPEGNIR